MFVLERCICRYRYVDQYIQLGSSSHVLHTILFAYGFSCGAFMVAAEDVRQLSVVVSDSHLGIGWQAMDIGKCEESQNGLLPFLLSGGCVY